MSDLLLRALRREKVERTPVWFMRQAGRCLPGYREIRRAHGFEEIVRDPERAAEVTELPLDYFAVDGLVLFMDLSTPFEAAGLEVELRAGVGPVVLDPWAGPADVDRLVPFDPRVALDYVLEAIKLVVSRRDVPVLGFVGAPFTLCSYLVRGSRTQRLASLKAFMLRQPELWDRLAGFWADHLADFAIAQHEAGAGAIQIFDSWAGVLSPEQYGECVQPYTARLLRTLADANVPTINFAVGNPGLLPALATAGGDAVGVDWRLPIDEAWRLIGHDRAIQGNLDPSTILAGEAAALAATEDILRRTSGRPGHIFNVGHGLHPESDPRVLRAIVECVHSYPGPEASAP
ncbi:MAG: uroporphyrinogen decarboxylase [Gemmatimonadota bacterium]